MAIQRYPACKGQLKLMTIQSLAHHQQTIAPTLFHPHTIAMCHGLRERFKSIASKYLYDQEGSKLFDLITTQPEYYLTRSETAILSTYADEIVERFGTQLVNIIELGPGDGTKAALLLSPCTATGVPFRYIPVDVSEAALRSAMATLLKTVGVIEAQPLRADFTEAFFTRIIYRSTRSAILYLGSSIGNLTPTETCRMLSGLRSQLKPNDLMVIGFDLWKAADILVPAYDDTQGITREFNLNLLDRLNREAGATFQRELFTHRPVYNPFLQCMESYLESKVAHDVWIEALNDSIRFTAGEKIHIEYSFKYRPEQIAHLAQVSGFTVSKNYFDSNQHCVVSVWKANE